MNFYRFSDWQIVEEHGQPDLFWPLQQTDVRTSMRAQFVSESFTRPFSLFAKGTEALGTVPSA